MNNSCLIKFWLTGVTANRNAHFTQQLIQISQP